jgi:peptidyl-tRNA hydrolase, PTH1 family
VRVRIGIGKPPGRQEGADHVLRRPGKAERAELDVAMAEAADAVEMILAEGAEAAQTRFNQRG